VSCTQQVFQSHLDGALQLSRTRDPEENSSSESSKLAKHGEGLSKASVTNCRFLNDDANHYVQHDESFNKDSSRARKSRWHDMMLKTTPRANAEQVIQFLVHMRQVITHIMAPTHENTTIIYHSNSTTVMIDHAK
jgi:hypothetical protein